MIRCLLPLLFLSSPLFAQGSDIWLDARVKPLPTDKQGPFVRTSQGEILAIDGKSSYVSSDSGKTWSAGCVLDPGGAMYSCLTVLRDGSIGVLYERGPECSLVFARFPLEWVLEGASSPTVPEGRLERSGKFGWWMQRHEQKLDEGQTGAETGAFHIFRSKWVGNLALIIQDCA